MSFNINNKRLLSDEDLHQSLNSTNRNEIKNQFGSFAKSSQSQQTQQQQRQPVIGYNTHFYPSKKPILQFAPPSISSVQQTTPSSNHTSVNSRVSEQLKKLKTVPGQPLINTPQSKLSTKSVLELDLDNIFNISPTKQSQSSITSSNSSNNSGNTINNNHNATNQSDIEDFPFDFDDSPNDGNLGTTPSIDNSPHKDNVKNIGNLYKSILVPKQQITPTKTIIQSNSSPLKHSPLKPIQQQSSTETTTKSKSPIKGQNLNDEFDRILRQQKGMETEQDILQMNNNNTMTQQKVISDKDIKELIENQQFRRFALSIRDHIWDLKIVQGYTADMQPLPTSLPRPLYNAFTKRNFIQLYSHQLESRDAISSGKDIIVTTPTSSGKSICLTLPIFEQIICQRLKGQKTNTAMFLFPLNALANTQLKSINELNDALDKPYQLKIISINAETNKDYLSKLFNGNECPDIILTSPDWLHFQLKRGGVSELWKGWREWFSRLKYIVLDEVHTYTGAMGCNFVNLVRRINNYHEILMRNTTMVNKLQFLLASATIGNPKQMAMKLVGKTNDSSIQLIDRNGSGSHGKVYLILHPTSSNSFHQVPLQIIHQWIVNDIRGIIFCNSIRIVNQIIQSISSDQRYSHHTRYVKAYYSSISNEVKQDILKQIRTGSTKIIVSTNALEAGIDIPELEACMVIGYPGSKLSWKQRVGRVGRSKQGIVVFIPTYNSPIDKYYSQNPDILLNDQVESLSFNGDFPAFLTSHLLCAASEIGIPTNDSIVNVFGPNSRAIIDGLIKENKIKIHYVGNRSMWVSNEYTHREFSFRGGSGLTENIRVCVGSETGLSLEHVPKLQAFSRLYPGAIFMSHSGKEPTSYEVTEFNLTNGYAIVKHLPSHLKQCKINTIPFISSHIEMKSITKKKSFPFIIPNITLEISFGIAKYTKSVTGYQKKIQQQQQQYNNNNNDNYRNKYINETENITYNDKQILQIHFEAPAIQFTILNQNKNSELKEYFKNQIGKLEESIDNSLILNRKDSETKLNEFVSMGESFVTLHTIVHQIISTAPTLLLCNRNDIEECINNSNTDTQSNNNNNNSNNNTNSNNNNNNTKLPMIGRSNQSIDTQNLSNIPNVIHIIDSNEGGTGTCLDIFENINRIFAQYFEIPDCSNCSMEVTDGNIISDDIGCINCLHLNTCDKGILKPMGIQLLDLKIVSKSHQH